MRKSAKWMTIWDERILEIASAEDSVSPKKLEDSGYFDVGRAQISRRCRILADHEMLQALGNGVYIITDRGENYLDGQYDPRDKSDDENGQEVVA